MKKNNIFSFMAIALLNLFSFSLMAQRTPIGNLLVEGVGEIPTSVSERLDQYQNLRSAGFADWDASGKGLYINTHFADVTYSVIPNKVTFPKINNEEQEVVVLFFVKQVVLKNRNSITYTNELRPL
jgi:hypothetical protein